MSAHPPAEMGSSVPVTSWDAGLPRKEEVRLANETSVQINPIPETSRAPLGDPCCVGTCMGSLARAAVKQQWLTNRKSFSYRVRNQVADRARLSLKALLTSYSFQWLQVTLGCDCASPIFTLLATLAGPLLCVNLTPPHSDETPVIGGGLSTTLDGYTARSLTHLCLQRSLSEEGTLPGLESGPEWTFTSEQLRQRSVSRDSCQPTYLRVLFYLYVYFETRSPHRALAGLEPPDSHSSWSFYLLAQAVSEEALSVGESPAPLWQILVGPKSIYTSAQPQVEFDSFPIL